MEQADSEQHARIESSPNIGKAPGAGKCSPFWKPSPFQVQVLSPNGSKDDGQVGAASSVKVDLRVLPPSSSKARHPNPEVGLQTPSINPEAL